MYMYECQLKNNKEFQEFAKNYKKEIVEPLNPRDAFYGGRTNCTKPLCNNIVFCTYEFKMIFKTILYVECSITFFTVNLFFHYIYHHSRKENMKDIFLNICVCLFLYMLFYIHGNDKVHSRTLPLILLHRNDYLFCINKSF